MKFRRECTLSHWPWLVWPALLGFVLALFGTYWDDAWHTEKGRDTFLAAPHIALYAGISLSGGALTLWALFAARRAGVRAVLAHPPLLLSVVGVVVTLGGAPVDNAWHEAFGRDAVVWSPPHMLGVVGTLGIATGLLLELASWREKSRLLTIAAAAVLAVACIPVLEYETDVPQFGVVFYLPVLAFGSAFALGLIRLLIDSPWSATRSAIAHTVLVAAIAAVLAATSMPAPLVPLLALPAAALDAAAKRRRVIRPAAAYVLSLYLVYVPYLNWVKSDIQLEVGDVAIGLPIAFLATALALYLTAEDARRPSRALLVGATTAVAALIFSAGAGAHDPGQGEVVATVDAVVAAEGDLARLEIDASSWEHCDDLIARSLLARRAGEEVTAALSSRAPCEFAGTIGLPERGRWFVYAQLAHGDDVIETWLPVHAETNEVVRDPHRPLYLPPEVESPAVKTVAGFAIYGLLAGSLVWIPILYRRTLPKPPRAQSGS